ncbi:hypothetical protein ACIOGT_16840 [Streptomyces microflavus]|uniref:hypothetical protein n=1 Tax=Streptomyces microflavus TaxID=1919 RepID=UPI003825AB4C
MTKRRCAVDFDVPKHGGNARQAPPLTSTWMIAVKTASSSMLATPPPCLRNNRTAN